MPGQRLGEERGGRGSEASLRGRAGRGLPAVPAGRWVGAAIAWSRGAGGAPARLHRFCPSLPASFAPPPGAPQIPAVCSLSAPLAEEPARGDRPRAPSTLGIPSLSPRSRGHGESSSSAPACPADRHAPRPLRSRWGTASWNQTRPPRQFPGRVALPEGWVGRRQASLPEFQRETCRGPERTPTNTKCTGLHFWFQRRLRSPSPASLPAGAACGPVAPVLPSHSPPPALVPSGCLCPPLSPQPSVSPPAPLGHRVLSPPGPRTAHLEDAPVLSGGTWGRGAQTC